MRPKVTIDLVAAGARPPRTVAEHGGYHAVLADPEGNEFSPDLTAAP